MLQKSLAAFISLFIAGAVLAQDKAGTQKDGNTVEPVNLPVQSVRTHVFDVEKFSISFGYEPRGFGEVLTVEFGLRNKTDEEKELYIWTIATEDVDPSADSSFKMPRTDDQRILFRNFVPFPLAAEDRDKEFRLMKHENFRYKTEKDTSPIGSLRKFPRDPKLGIDPATGKAYKLEDALFIKTSHNSKYRKNYCFFNHVTLLIFDAKNLTDEKGALNPPLYRQIYRIVGKRK